MKTRIKNLLLLLLLLVLPAVVQAQNAYSTNADGSIYTYSTNADGSANIVAYAGPPWVVTIPTNIDGLTVTSIGTTAFEYNTNLTSVTIPGSVTSIGDSAFYNSGITSVTIPNSVTTIGNQAFFGCTRLTSVTIPGSVTSIGAYAFEQCGLTNVTLDIGVTSIGNFAFLSCSSLTSVTIPNSVTSIADGAFELSGLTSVTIPASVTDIGDSAFYLCASLTNVAVDAANPAYSSMNGVLFDKAQVTLLEFPGGLGGSYTIPDSVTSIREGAFDDCFSLTSVTIPNSVTSIGAYAFAGTSLTSVTIPNSVTSIEDDVFIDCSGLTSVTIPNSVTSVGGYAFAYCTSLTSVYFTGNAPSPNNDSTVFGGSPFYDPATVYYLPGTTGWGALFDGQPTAPWFLPNPQILNQSANFGVQAGGFGFTISWATNVSVVVEAATNLANPVWIPVSTNPLTNGTSYFSDPQWTNYPERFYRATSAFTVGGMLTGLPAGDTVTLQDNGSDNLTLSANGTFTFPTALPNGHAYSVTVSGTSGGTLLGTLSLNDFADVRNGSGTISGANVTNVVVPCAAITGNPDLDMYNAAVADGTEIGGEPGVMLTENGGPFRVTAIGPYTHTVALVYNGWARPATVEGHSCSLTTFPSGTDVIQFGIGVICSGGPYGW